MTQRTAEPTAWGTDRVTDLRAVLRSGAPLIDVRSPGEFARGALPGALNLPVLDDDQRAAVGTRYRSHGQQAAIALGEELVSGALRERRLAEWCTAAERRPDTLLYCWRGGLRSQIVQRWMRERGCPLPRVDGGFKALRNACLDTIERFAADTTLWVLGGRTGSGKTLLLNTVSRSLDLEGLANHRGSAFGAAATPQPTPVDFENALAVAMLHHDPGAPVLLEDESRTIGRLAVPATLHEAMQRAPLVIVDVDRSARSEHIWREYVDEPLAIGTSADTLENRYLSACDRIRRRLGGLHHGEIRSLIASAFRTENDPAAHQRWIEALLEHYYDPMYDYQLAAKTDRVAFTGHPPDVLNFAKTRDIY